MTRDQVQFLISGILFGFLIGFLIAYGVYQPRVVEHAAAVPAAGNQGMGGGPETAGVAEADGAPEVDGVAQSPGAPGRAGAPGSGSAAGAHAPEQTMARVFEEVNALKAALAKNPRDRVALIRMANIYHDAGKYDQAISYYQRALAIEPKDVDARTDMGICLREMGKSDDALAQFRTSLTYNPQHWQTWLNLGVVSLFDRNDVAGAGEAFAKVESLNPGFKDLPLLKEALKKAREGGARKAP